MFVVHPVAFGDDPVFALHREAAARIAAGQDCVNATLGVLIDDHGALAVLPTMAQVVADMQPADWAAYASTVGLDAFCSAVIDDCFGAHPSLRARALALAAPGATGAIRNAMTLFLDRNQVCLSSSLCWSTYPIIAQAAGYRFATFRMFAPETHEFDVNDFDRALSAIVADQGRALVLLNDPCHNPTGYSMSETDWANVADVLHKHSRRAPICVLLDTVYAAFSAHGTRRALSALEPLADRLLLLLAWSASKSFTGYGLRAGALIAVAPDAREHKAIRDTLAAQCCGTWANCNRGGLAAVARVLAEPALAAAVADERRGYAALLARRAAAFDDAVARNPLPRPAYDGGFFTSVFAREPAFTAAALRREGVYVVPIEGGLRVALSAVPTAHVRRLALALSHVLQDRSADSDRDPRTVSHP
jgi:aromatic-amino-acid transaminase